MARRGARAYLSDRFGDFYGGMLHPVTALEHALPMFALALTARAEWLRIAVASPAAGSPRSAFS